MTDTNKDEPLSKDQILELYKLHAELADRLHQRREGVNRLYVTILVGLLVFLSAIIQFRPKGWPVHWILFIFLPIGIRISQSWEIAIESYRRSSCIKSGILCEIEKALAKDHYSFFCLEQKIQESIQEKYRSAPNLKNLLLNLFTMPFRVLSGLDVLSTIDRHWTVITVEKHLARTFGIIFFSSWGTSLVFLIVDTRRLIHR